MPASSLLQLQSSHKLAHLLVGGSEPVCDEPLHLPVTTRGSWGLAPPHPPAEGSGSEAIAHGLRLLVPYDRLM
jgi:hypothetical protein